MEMAIFPGVIRGATLVRGDPLHVLKAVENGLPVKNQRLTQWLGCNSWQQRQEGDNISHTAAQRHVRRKVACRRFFIITTLRR